MQSDKTTTRSNHSPRLARGTCLVVAATAALAISLGAAPAEAGDDFRHALKHELGRVLAQHVAAPFAFWRGRQIVYERHHSDHGRHYYRPGHRSHRRHWRPRHRDHHYHEGSRTPCRAEHREQRGHRVRYDY